MGEPTRFTGMEREIVFDYYTTTWFLWSRLARELYLRMDGWMMVECRICSSNMHLCEYTLCVRGSYADPHIEAFSRG